MAMRNDTQRTGTPRTRSLSSRRSRQSKPADVASALHGIDFPTSKSELIAYADEHACGDAVIRALDHLPERVYENMAEVERDLTAAQRDEGHPPRDLSGNTMH
jgi:hypothetical protein